jgi:holo-[acyl-carrier protein] synthase
VSQHIGVDIVEIARIKKVCARWGEIFLTRVFTSSELELYRTKYASLAARFAAKEAVVKALNACGSGISWQDIEVLTGSGGEPSLNLRGKAQKIAAGLAIDDLKISLSHSNDYAVAFVVGSSQS